MSDDDDAMSVSSVDTISSSFTSTSNYGELKNKSTIAEETPASTSDIKQRHLHLKIKKERDVSDNQKKSKLQDLSNEKVSNWGLQTLVIIVCLTLTVIVAFFVTSSLTSSTSRRKINLDMHAFKRALKTTVFGQDPAILAILSEITTPNEDRLKVILLVGGPGVGKDLLAQTVALEFFRQRGSKCKSSSYLLLDHTDRICVRSDFNVISIETVRDEKDITKAINLLKQMFDQDVKGIVFLPILAAKALKEHNSAAFETLRSNEDYNSLVSSKGESFKLELSKEGIYYCRLILFKPISKETIQKCLGLNRVNDQKLIDFVMDGREFALNGCKGLEYLSKTGF